MVENPGFAGRIGLEGADPLVGFGGQVRAVVIDAHQLGAVIGRHVLARFGPGVEHLLAEIQRPVEAGRVVVDQLGVGDHFADAADHATDLADVRLFGFDPQQVRAVLKAGDAVQHAAVLAGSRTELEEVAGQALGLEQLAVAADQDVAVADFGHFLAIEEAVVLVADVAGFAGEGDLLGQAGAERVGAGDDDPVVNAQFHEGVPDRADLREEVLVRNGDLAVLVAALLFVGHLVFDLQRAGAGFDHLLGKQIGRFGIAEPGVDVGDDRHDMGFEPVDLGLDLLGLDFVTGLAGFVKLAEQAAQLAGVGLAQEGVELLDQRGNAGLLMHRLIGQGAEFAAQRGDHPARKVQIPALGRAEVLLDRDQLLLTDEAVPAAQRLGVVGRIGIIGGHVLAHDLGGVLGDIESGPETVLQPHAGDGFGADPIPVGVLGNGLVSLGDDVGVAHGNLHGREWP